MIEFNCQHCGKALHLNDSYAGRDGWCRVCKRMVIVPDGGPPVRIEDLPPEEGYVRLQRLLQYAATKADQYKAHLKRQVLEEEKLAKLEEALRQANSALAESKSQVQRLHAELGQARKSLDGFASRIIELESALRAAGEDADSGAAEVAAVLRAELAAERGAREALESRLRDRAVEHTELQEEFQAYRQTQEKLQRAAAADSGQRRALERELVSVKAQLQHVEQDRDRIVCALEDGTAGADDTARILLEKDTEISALTAEVARLKFQQEEAGRTTREHVNALEEQASLFEEVKGRLASLQKKLNGLEQERLDASLALDESRRAEQLALKKLSAVETSLRKEAEEKAGQAVRVEQLQCDLAGRDGHVRKLSEELEALTAAHNAAILAGQKSSRAAKAAEGRAEKLAAELAGAQEARDASATQADLAERRAAGLEAEVRSLRKAFEETRGASASQKESLDRYVAELQAEVMNLNEALERARAGEMSETASLAGEVERLKAETQAREAALSEVRERARQLDVQLEQQRESPAPRQGEEENLARLLAEVRRENEALKAALAVAEDRGLTSGAGVAPDRDEVTGFDEADVIVLDTGGAGPAETGAGDAKAGIVDALSERKRQLEKQEMMDALSDFLNK